MHSINLSIMTITPKELMFAKVIPLFKTSNPRYSLIIGLRLDCPCSLKKIAIIYSLIIGLHLDCPCFLKKVAINYSLIIGLHMECPCSLKKIAIIYSLIIGLHLDCPCSLKTIAIINQQIQVIVFVSVWNSSGPFPWFSCGVSDRWNI